MYDMGAKPRGSLAGGVVGKSKQDGRPAWPQWEAGQVHDEGEKSLGQKEVLKQANYRGWKKIICIF